MIDHFSLIYGWHSSVPITSLVSGCAAVTDALLFEAEPTEALLVSGIAESSNLHEASATDTGCSS